MNTVKVTSNPTVSTVRAAPAFIWSPAVRKRVNQLRLRTDLIGLAIVHTVMPLGNHFAGWVNLLLSIYNVMALVTILTIDPTRLPEAAATRIQQRRAWVLSQYLAPVWILLSMAIIWLGDRAFIHPLVPSVGMVIGWLMDEMIYRNMLQPALRRMKLPRSAAILAQSTLYALPFALIGKPPSYLLCLAILGIVNGFIVAKTRSLWPTYANTILAHVLFLG